MVERKNRVSGNEEKSPFVDCEILTHRCSHQLQSFTYSRAMLELLLLVWPITFIRICRFAHSQPRIEQHIYSRESIYSKLFSIYTCYNNNNNNMHIWITSLRDVSLPLFPLYILSIFASFATTFVAMLEPEDICYYVFYLAIADATVNCVSAWVFIFGVTQQWCIV